MAPPEGLSKEQAAQYVAQRGDCAQGNFTGTFVRRIAIITPNEEHKYNKLDLIEIESPDHTKAYTLVNHGLDV